MKRTVRVRPEAERDIRDAYKWYEGQRAGLGSDFLLCIEEGPAKIRRSPDMYPVVRKNVRRIPIRRFPYGAFHLLDQSAIVVLAVSHAHRDPKTWQSRE